MIFVGMDLGKRSHAVCLLNDAGQQVARPLRVAHTGAGLRQVLAAVRVRWWGGLCGCPMAATWFGGLRRQHRLDAWVTSAPPRTHLHHGAATRVNYTPMRNK